MNNKIVAVWGNSDSGKTTLSVKLAKKLADEGKEVLLVFTDILAPTIVTLMPDKDMEEKSLGNILSAPNMTQETILKNCISINKKFTVIGYRDEENAYSYADYTEERAKDLLILLRSLADAVIIDCSSSITGNSNQLSLTALEMADEVLRLGTCDLKGVTFFNSQLQLLADRKYNANNHTRILSNVKSCEPIDHVTEQYQGIKYQIPNVPEIEEQYLSAELFERLKEKRSTEYISVVEKIAEDVFELKENVKELKTKKEKKELPKLKFDFLKRKKLKKAGGHIE